MNAWVKKGILLGFRMGAIVDMSVGDLSFRDKETYPLRHFGPEDGVRIVPGGSSMRQAAAISARGSPACRRCTSTSARTWATARWWIRTRWSEAARRWGGNCHISAASQIGGVLEPVGASPVIIEDDVLVGGNCGIYEGTVVKRRAVLGTGTILNRSTPVYDLVRGAVYRATDASRWSSRKRP